MRVKIVKEHIMIDFQEKFESIFFDQEFGFKADDKLITKLIACLTYEYYNPDKKYDNKSIIHIGGISTKIKFVYKG